MPVSSWASSYMTMSKEKPRREDLVLVENWMTPPELNRIHSWPVCEQTSTRSLRQRGIPSDVSPTRRPKILRKRPTISMVVE
nr:MAG TPA: FAM212 family [Caudoviricetes sp.]